MSKQTIFCEECVEEVAGDEVFWEDERIYCKRCGSELESPDRDIFEEIVDNRSGFLFRDMPDEEKEEEGEHDEGEEKEDDKAEEGEASEA